MIMPPARLVNARRFAPNSVLKEACCLSLGVLLAFLTILPLGEAIYSARMAYDPALGKVFWPGKCVLWRREGNGRSLWSEHNIRRERLPTANERPVILVFGDSMTEALQVNDCDVYTRRLEESLRTCGIPAAVLNAGRSGRSLADYVEKAKVYQDLFSPDWVIVQLTWCDFQEAMQTSRPVHFRRNETNALLEVVARRPLAGPGRAFRAFSSLPAVLTDHVTLAYPAYRADEFVKWIRTEPPWFRAPPPTRVDGNVVHDFRFGEGAVALQTPARLPYDTTEKNTFSQELDFLKKSWNGRVTLLLLTSYNPLGPANLRPDEREIDALARNKGISIVRLDEGFGRLPPRVSPYGFDNLGGYNTGHMNPSGHRLAADLLASELRRIASTNGLF